MNDDLVPKRKPMIVRQLRDELLVYDKKSKKAYCLNTTAADVWGLCDGKRTTEKIVRHFGSTEESVIDENMTRLTLRKLQRSGLLTTGVIEGKRIAIPSRRLVLKKLGVATA